MPYPYFDPMRLMIVIGIVVPLAVVFIVCLVVVVIAVVRAMRSRGGK